MYIVCSSINGIDNPGGFICKDARTLCSLLTYEPWEVLQSIKYFITEEPSSPVLTCELDISLQAHL